MVEWRRYVSEVRFQTAPALTDDDNGWQDWPWLIPVRAVRAGGQIIGDALAELRWGEILDDHGRLVRPGLAPAPRTLCRFVRVDVGQGGTETLVPLWYGVVDRRVWSPDGRKCEVRCKDLKQILADFYVTSGYIRNGGGFDVQVTTCPPANAQFWGDRSTDKGTGESYVHVIGSTGNDWHAGDLAELLLKRLMQPDLPGMDVGQAVKWDLDLGSNDYVGPQITLAGRRVGELLCDLFNERRGLTWYPDVRGDTVFVKVVSFTGQPINDLDFTGNPWIQNPSFDENGDGFDYIRISGARPLVGITLSWKPGATDTALIPDGWTPGSAADTALDAAAEASESQEVPTPYDAPEWRRFKLNPAWDALNWGFADTTGLRRNDSDVLDGTRAWDPDVMPPPPALDLERQLPWSEAFGTLKTGSRQSAIVVAGKSGTWEDLSSQCRPIIPNPPGTGSFGAQPATLLLGDSAEAAQALRDNVGTDGEVLVSIGVREWEPLSVAWMRPQSQWPCPTPRVISIHRPNLEQWLGLSGTVRGTDGDGNLHQVGEDDVIRNDLTKLQTLLDQAIARWGYDRTRFTWTERGVLDETLQPGTMVDEVIMSSGDAYAVVSPITSITYEFRSKSYGQTILGIPIAPELELLT